MIDHGAAFYRQHGDRPLAQSAAAPFPLIAEHVLLGAAGAITDAHERLAPAVDRDLLARVTDLVPDEWLDGTDRDIYVDYLERRVRDGAFAEEAERARAGA